MAQELVAELVASVFKIVASVGDRVEPGGTAVILESMKMEIPVLAEDAGMVREIPVHEGDVVQEGDVLAVLT
jgi:acetyl-CoA carboxylase biotin carboxyl carrier protein